MIAYVTGDLIDSSRGWSPHEIEQFAQGLAERFRGRARVTDLALSQGDSFQLEARGKDALSIALLLDALARRGGRLGMRVAFAMQATSDASLPISVRSGPAYVAAGRGIAELKRLRQRIGFFGASAAETGWGTACMLCGTLADGHSAHQSEILADLLVDRHTTQAAIAARLGVTQQAISKHYQAGRLPAILSAEAAFRAYFREDEAEQ